ncbi:MAG TPA: type II toxin-antitoxin system VapC family toxin [Solirubrobacteraceae bacterium]|nr:type II toxin-antitoxin system VapC family toxin [Solirubrobacteraceae bacterium]
MIAYLDSSMLVRSYLSDEDGHEQAVALLEDPNVTAVTGTWTRIEVSGALIRAARSGHHKTDEHGLLATLDADLDTGGRVAELTIPQENVEDRALELVRAHPLRALDAWHLAVASLTVPALAQPEQEEIAFASRDEDQATVAEQLGFKRI